MTRFRLLCLPALLACAGAAGAAESIPTPTYTDFMGSCSVAATEKGLKGAELGVMGLMCHCSFKKVQPQSRPGECPPWANPMRKPTPRLPHLPHRAQTERAPGR